MTVFAVHAWNTNAALIADVARLGYLDGSVLDATHGEGAFWTVWKPESLTTNDLYKPADHAEDYTRLPFSDSSFDAVVFDPPYKLSGTPALGQFDDAYGIAKPMRWQDRMENVRLGAVECYRVAATWLLVKCQDQVVSGQVRWQTDMVTRAIEGLGGRKVDRFDFVKKGQPQPGGRRQVTARRNCSQLLVFRKESA